jgi:hypothetical protein
VREGLGWWMDLARRSTWWLMAVWGLLVVAVCGCGRTHDVDSHVRLSEGSHRIVALIVTDEPRGYVLTVRDAGTTHAVLVITPLDDADASCDAGPARDVTLVSPIALDSGPHFMRADGALRVMDAERGVDGPFDSHRLWHVDLECNSRPPMLEGVAELGHASAVPVWARTVAGDLWALDVDAGERSLIATDVTQFLHGRLGEGMWTVESGQIVRRDHEDGRELARNGSGVMRIVHVGHDPSAYAFETDEGVHVADDLDAEPRLLEPGGCGVDWRRGGPELESLLLMWSPCEERRLVFHDLVQGERWAYGADMGFLMVLHGDGSGPPWLMLATGAEEAFRHTPASVGAAPLHAVWVAEPSGEPTQVARHVVRLLSHIRGGPARMALLGETEGTVSAAQLQHGEGLSVVATGLADLWSTTLAFTRMEAGGAVGDAARLDWETGALDPLGTGVPARSVRRERIGENFVDVYVRHADPQTLAGVLEVRDPSGHREVIAADVVQHRYVTWPRAGFVYTAESSLRQGLWFVPHPPSETVE